MHGQDRRTRWPGQAIEPADGRIADSAWRSALRSLDMIGSDAQAALDRLTALASRLLDAPVSLVTVIAEDRQVFLGQHGLEPPLAQGRQTPLSHSFCRHVVQARCPLIVRDARDEPLVRENPAVTELGVIAYLGVPVALDDEGVVGAMCAIDRRPREWSARDLETVEDLAVVAAELIGGRAALVHGTLHDRLTGLPNRELLVAAGDELLEHLDPGEHVAILCAGIDHFNMINQALGTENADRVLQAVAERLACAVRDADVFGRLRGDVFALVAPGVHDQAEALSIAARLQGALAQPLSVNGEPLSVGVTIGIALADDDVPAADAVSEAANAMREAKRSQGRMRLAAHDRSNSAVTQLRLREALREAPGRGEIAAVFQPIVALEGRDIVGFETLARWAHPEFGDVSPAEFIPLAELTADILPIGECVLRQMAAFAAALCEADALERRVTLNVSPLQLQQPNFADTVRDALAAHGLSGDVLGVEITEGVLLESGPTQQANLSALQDFGARILLDDFGTGYSSLSYLQDFAIDTIKIDRSFVVRIAEERPSAALIQAILAMARGMDLEVVAEGIETDEQAKLLRLLGCRYGQGYHLGMPLAAEEAIAAARASRASARRSAGRESRDAGAAGFAPLPFQRGAARGARSL